MRGIRLDFTSAKGAAFDFGTPLEGFDTTVQNILVEVGQKSGSDSIYTEKGNQIHKNSVSGGFVDPESFSVGLGELSAKIQNFIQNNEDPENTVTLQNVNLDLDIWDSDAARLKVTALNSDGETVGVTTSL
jgi:hypothetical protein